MTDLLLATCAGFPAGEPGHDVLDRALKLRGIESVWVCWDDPEVDWSAADLVAVRSTWDYVPRAAEFLAWAREVAAVTELLNGPEVFAWNHDKRYLAELYASGDLPVVPTWTAESRADLSAGVRRLGRAVVKPRISAGGAGLLIVEDPEDPRLGTPVVSHPTYPPVGGPWVVQPVVESIVEQGERSLFVIEGEVVAQVDKWPAAGEVRVHEEFGGRSQAGTPDPVCAELASQAAALLSARFGDLPYARVDLLCHDDRWVISELELIEPGLYLDVTDAAAGPFADMGARRVAT